ncbi:MAG: 3-keto-disaccharide hydrolase [Terriglobia bacterium]
MRTLFFATFCCLLAVAVPLPPRTAHAQTGNGGWVTLFDGKNLDQWNQIGDANWKLEDGAVVATKGNGFLVSKEAYGDFQLKVEFWVNDAANSGVFIRSEDPKKIAGATAYEVNIYDQRPDPTYGTGAIVNVAKVDPMPKAGGKWNTYEITAKGPHLTAVLNGVKTAGGENDKHKKGHIALQYGTTKVKDAGIVKFRLVEIRPL